jgi:hypothetical protein
MSDVLSVADVPKHSPAAFDQTLDLDHAFPGLHAGQHALQRPPRRIALDIHRHAEADQTVAVVVEPMMLPPFLTFSIVVRWFSIQAQDS